MNLKDQGHGFNLCEFLQNAQKEKNESTSDAAFLYKKISKPKRLKSLELFLNYIELFIIICK